MSHFGILRMAIIAGCGALVGACADQSAPVAAGPAPAKSTAGHAYLTVERGQSLDKIAQTYHVTKHDLIAANHLQPPYTVAPGTVLEIPPGEARPQAKAKPRPKTPVAAAARAKPAQTAAVSAPARGAKTKPSEPEIIPLD